MSIHLPGQPVPPSPSLSGESSSTSDDQDQTWDDWVSDSEAKKPTKSLFDDTICPSTAEALEHDKVTHGFDLVAVSKALVLDFHQQVRLINYIRQEKPAPEALRSLNGSEPLFSDDIYLKPVIEDDPLLQLQSDDWSDSDEDAPPTQKTESSPQIELLKSKRRIKKLEEKLAAAKQDIRDFRKMVDGKFELLKTLGEEDASLEDVKAARKQERDDDSHYFQSYAENDIHATMILDRVRTSTYASFILSNPSLFKDAVVLDVGCGTGILSLFAAKAGAKKVVAVDASAVAENAAKIVQANAMESVITVIHGKVEDVVLPDGIDKVDVIISEWMGYALLYESMLDSVLKARDRFLKPTGVMAPSQCRMMLALSDAETIYKERIGFWDDVYGFDMKAMAEHVYEDAIADIVPAESLLTTADIVKDLHLGTMHASSLDFSASFSLSSISRPMTPGQSKPKTKARAFVLWFDTFFDPSGGPVPHNQRVKLMKKEGNDVVTADVMKLNRRKTSDKIKQIEDEGKSESFSTGPASIPTHWKQTIMLLREPIQVKEGRVVKGTIHCRKSEENSRELDIEIHYAVSEEDEEPVDESVVAMYKVR